MTRRNLLHIRREPMQLSDVTIQPALFVGLFVYVFGSAMVIPGGTYKQFAIGGLLTMILVTATPGTAVGISTDLATAASRPSLVLIPGGPGESSGMLRWVLNEKDMLNGMMKYLNVNIVLFDPRGTGTSVFARPVSEYDPGAVSTQRMTDDLLALVDAVSPAQPVYLMSHSAGGSVAVQLARPSRIVSANRLPAPSSSSTTPRTTRRSAA